MTSAAGKRVRERELKKLLRLKETFGDIAAVTPSNLHMKSPGFGGSISSSDGRSLRRHGGAHPVGGPTGTPDQLQDTHLREARSVFVASQRARMPLAVEFQKVRVFMSPLQCASVLDH